LTLREGKEKSRPNSASRPWWAQYEQKKAELDIIKMQGGSINGRERSKSQNKNK